MLEYVERFYRSCPISAGMMAFSVQHGPSDLHIVVDRASYTPLLIEQTQAVLVEAHACLKEWCRHDARFLTALAPYSLPARASPLIGQMAQAGAAAGVGPMAAVAGTIAELVARALTDSVEQVWVENGGDVYTMGDHPVNVGVFAGASPLSLRFSLRVEPPMAVCTSSGRVGPSLSMGTADAAVVVASSGALADALATALGNRIQSGKDIAEALDWVRLLPGAEGAVAICGDQMGAVGVVLEPA